MDSTTLNLRLPKVLKKNAQEIIEKNGLDLPSALRLFLSHVVVRGTIPLQWITVNGFTPEAEKKMLEALHEKDDLITLKPDDDISAFIDDL